MEKMKITESYLQGISKPSHIQIWMEYAEGCERVGGQLRPTNGCYSLLTIMPGTYRHRDIYIVERVKSAEDSFIAILNGYSNTIIMENSPITQFEMKPYPKTSFVVYVVTYVSSVSNNVDFGAGI